MIRSGIGFDAHQLKKGIDLYIGGVKINSDLGSLGHSDGDALIHALADSLLGAAGMGDIGQYFPSDKICLFIFIPSNNKNIIFITTYVFKKSHISKYRYF